MPRESLAAKRARAVEVCRRMDDLFPEAECALHFSDPFSLVIAVLLSAQTTDAAVNKVTPVLFDRWPTPADLAGAPLPEVEEILHPLGFFRSKARHVVECAQMVVSDFGGEVPRTMAELTRLPGVGRKTANIVLNNAFGIVEGIAVDTHVFRIATRLGFNQGRRAARRGAGPAQAHPPRTVETRQPPVGALRPPGVRRAQAGMPRGRCRRGGNAIGRTALPLGRPVPELRQAAQDEGADPQGCGPEEGRFGKGGRKEEDAEPEIRPCATMAAAGTPPGNGPGAWTWLQPGHGRATWTWLHSLGA